MRYARDTSVSCERSKAEVEATLRRYGADQFMSGWKDGQAAVQFRVKSKMVRFVLPLPDPKDDEFCLTGCSRPYQHDPEDRKSYHADACFKPRPEHLAERLWDQACRQRWRALALAIKAKLEAVECGITTFEEEFLAHIVIPGQHGKTLGQIMLGQIDEAYKTGSAPRLGWDG